MKCYTKPAALMACIFAFDMAAAQDFSTRTDPSVTPWVDPDNPLVILRDPNDPNAEFEFGRNSLPNPER